VDCPWGHAATTPWKNLTIRDRVRRRGTGRRSRAPAVRRSPVRRQGVDTGQRIGDSFEDASSPADGIQPRGGPPVISGLVPAGGDVGGAEAERAFHQPGPVVHAGFEVGGRGGHAERGQPIQTAPSKWGRS